MLHPPLDDESTGRVRVVQPSAGSIGQIVLHRDTLLDIPDDRYISFGIGVAPEGEDWVILEV